MDNSNIFKFFDEICQIPRESGHEEQIIAYLQSFANTHNLECRTDKAGNVVITRNASAGKENLPTVVLQSHSDMVCEKNGTSNHDFSKDPIKYETEDGWIIAKETTLGADCGIGMAAQMAVLVDQSLKLPKIEALFTTEEETGLTGAKSLKPGFITGKYLINLDSEDEGEIFIGCAGGIDTTARFSYTESAVKENSQFLKLHIHGATGGHSGDDINKQRANAVQLLAVLLRTLDKKFKIDLCLIDGGNKRNAIAREAWAVIAVENSLKASVEEFFNNYIKDISASHYLSDPQLSGTITAEKACSFAIDSASAKNLILSLNACPHGVIAMSQDIPGFVETSTNLASVKMSNKEEITVSTSQRSSISSERYSAAERIESVFVLAGAAVSHESEYPGWKPNPDSEILKIGKDSYLNLFGVEPIVRAIHAGLECGMFADIYPGLDMISFGPTLRGVHAPGEKLEIASVDKFWKLLIEILTNIK
jgi:dipeptidase D